MFSIFTHWSIVGLFILASVVSVAAEGENSASSRETVVQSGSDQVENPETGPSDGPEDDADGAVPQVLNDDRSKLGQSTEPAPESGNTDEVTSTESAGEPANAEDEAKSGTSESPVDNSVLEEGPSDVSGEITNEPTEQDIIDARKANADFAYGAYQRGYYLTAMNLALSRAQLGDPAAQTLVAEIFAQGLGIRRSMEDATFWYAQASEGGDPAAQFKYALLLLDGTHVERDETRAEALMKSAADAGIAEAQFNFGQMLIARNPGDSGIREAIPYFENSAESGIADAQYALSQILLKQPQADETTAVEARNWLIRAARAGYDTAQLDLAIWLVDGIGGDRDLPAGFAWMLRSALGGNVLAQNKLSHLYVNAIGTRPNPIEAAKWYVLSRRAGLEDKSLDDFYQGLTDDEQKAAIERANRFRTN